MYCGMFLYSPMTFLLQISVCSYILEICKEWELKSPGYLAVETGVRLARCIYGDKSKHYKAWLQKMKYFNTN